MHADLTADIMGAVGYDGDEIAVVRGLLTKRDLTSNDDVQTLEDVACLVFLDHYASDFASRHEAPKVVSILSKTWRKMSERGQLAVKALELDGELRLLLSRALSDH
jgi:hypothetical protein